jgi:hypothetical protein
MQHSCGDNSIEESEQSASSMTRGCKPVNFFLHGEIDNRRHDRPEANMHDGVWPLFLQARLEPFKVPTRDFDFTVQHLLIESGNGFPNIDRDRNGLDDSKEDNLWLVVSSDKMNGLRVSGTYLNQKDLWVSMSSPSGDALAPGTAYQLPSLCASTFSPVSFSKSLQNSVESPAMDFTPYSSTNN